MITIHTMSVRMNPSVAYPPPEEDEEENVIVEGVVSFQ
jgi:hypothetical protein